MQFGLQIGPVSYIQPQHTWRITPPAPKAFLRHDELTKVILDLAESLTT